MLSCAAIIPRVSTENTISSRLFLPGTNHSQNFKVKDKTADLLIHQEMNGCDTYLSLQIIFSVKENTTVWQQLCIAMNWKHCSKPSRHCFVYRVHVNTDFDAAPFILCSCMSPSLMTGNCKITGKYDALFCGSFAFGECLYNASAQTKQLLLSLASPRQSLCSI